MLCIDLFTDLFQTVCLCAYSHCICISQYELKYCSNFLVHLHTAKGSASLNLERQLDHEGHPLAITADAIAANGVSPWDWRGTPENGQF